MKTLPAKALSNERLTLGLGVFITIYVIFFTYTDYYSLDEPNFLWSLKESNGNWRPHMAGLIQMGRLMHGYLLLYPLSLLEDIEHLKILRAISAVLLFFFALQNYRFLKTAGVNPAVSRLFFIGIITLPSLTVYTAWAECYSHHLAAMFSFQAGVITLGTCQRQDSLTKRATFLFFAVMLMLLAFHTYQNMTLAFLLPWFYFVMTKNKPYRSLFILLSIMIGVLGTAMILYYASFKFLLYYYDYNIVGRGAFIHNYTYKFLWLGKLVLNASALHLLLVKAILVRHLLTGVLFIIGIVFIVKRRWIPLAVTAMFIVLSVLPHLVIEESWGASRNFSVMAIIILFFLIDGLDRLVNIGWAIRYTLVIIFISFHFVNLQFGLVLPQRKHYLSELDQIKNLKSDHKICLFDEPEITSDTRFLRDFYDEFNINLYEYRWPLEPAIKLHLLRLNKYTVEELSSVKFSYENCPETDTIYY